MADSRANTIHVMLLDTAKPSAELVRWYERHGYRVIDELQFEGVNYRSVLMEKDLLQEATS